MTASEPLALQRLVDRREVAGLLGAFAPPEVGLAMVRPDGRLFASGGAWPPGDLEACLAALRAARPDPGGRPTLLDGRWRCYPVQAGPGAQLAGWLLARSRRPDDGAALETALQRALSMLLDQALAKREVANETLDRYREINLLYRVGETIGACLDPALIPGLVLEESRRVIASDAGLVLLADGHANGQAQAAHGPAEAAAALAAVTREAVQQVVGTGRPAIVTALPAEDGQPQFGAALCAPLKVREQVVGSVVLGRLAGQPEFAASDEKLLMALAGQAAIALENARLHQAALVKERLEQELALAHSVQSSLLPRAVPSLPGWEFAAWWQPAGDVSGDFYDFIPHDDGQLGVVIGDVSDKGMAAALFMALTRSIVRASTVAEPSPASSLTQANRLLCADATGGMFVTLFYGQLEPATGALRFVNAGHNPPLHFHAATEQVSELAGNDIMLGFDDTWRFNQHAAALAPGDCLVLYTDGVTEAVNPTRDRFEDERLHAVVRAHRHASAGELLGAIRRALADFAAGAAPADDITLVVIRRLEAA